LALHERREVEQTRHDDLDIVSGQPNLLQQNLQILQSPAGQTVDTDAFSLELRRAGDAAVLQRDDVEHVLWIDVVNGAQRRPFVEGREEGTRIGEGNVGLPAEQVAQRVATASTRQVAELDGLFFEESLIGFRQQV